ncbi:hypothetical protein MMC24_002015 [Lignoscripta atroalba]|nr:hypothetical protein [Lignoscripta atroalba]
MASSTALVPALPPPPGETSNFVNPPSLWKENVIAQSVCLSIAATVFFLRTYVRLGIKRQWSLEDYMCSLSFAGLVSYSALSSTMMNKHGGSHGWNVTQSDANQLLFYFNIVAIVYGPIIFFTKFSILLLYIRVFSPRRWSGLYVMIRLYIIISFLFYFSITIVKIFECTPRPRIWDRSVPGTCINLSILLNVSGAFNTISDVLILIIPVNAVWNLNLSTKKKVGVCLVFTVGSVAPIFSAIGFAVRVQTSGSKDTPYNQPLILLWGSTAEVTTGVICACLPMLPALFQRRPRKPSANMAISSSNRCGAQPFPRMYCSGSGDNDLLSRDYLELGEDSFHAVGGAAANAITTEIKGGAGPRIEVSAPADEDQLRGQEGRGIMKTVRIERLNGRG